MPSPEHARSDIKVARNCFAQFVNGDCGRAAVSDGATVSRISLNDVLTIVMTVVAGDRGRLGFHDMIHVTYIIRNFRRYGRYSS